MLERGRGHPPGRALHLVAETQRRGGIAFYQDMEYKLDPDYAKALEPGGTLILTGILAEREPVVRKALEAEGFAPRQRRQEGEWVLLAYTR